MVTKSVVGVVAASLMMCTSTVFAADLDGEAAAGGVYGNLHIGAFGLLNDTDGEATRIPGINGGGKLAVDYSDSPWGWQVDGDVSHVELGWVEPSIDNVDGSISVIDTAAHMTYRTDSSTKLGLFAGYGSITFQAEDTTSVEEVDLTIGTATLGVEALTEVDDATWLQGRVGIIDPVYINATINDGVTVETFKKTDILGKNMGGMAGASIHHRFNQNISGRAEVAYSHIGVSTDASIDILNLGITGNYTFDQTPLTLAVSGGYTAMAFDDTSSDGVSLRTSATWSFGGPSSGATGKLFRSGALGFGN